MAYHFCDRTSETHDGSIPQQKELLALLELLPRYDLTLSRVLDEPIFDSQASAQLGDLKPEDALEALKTLVEDSSSKAVRDLIAEAETTLVQRPIATPREQLRVDPLEGVPTLEPTYRPGSADNEEQGAVPIRLDALRGHLASLTSKRQVAHSEPIRRQQELEESAYDAARKQMERERELFKDSVVAMRKGSNPVKTMRHLIWDWTLLLAERIKEELKATKDDASTSESGASLTVSDSTRLPMRNTSD